MKSTGIVRKVDDLGRIVIPMETRRTLGIEEKDSIEIFTEDDKLILRKHIPGCMASGCKEASNLVEVQGIRLCREHARLLVKVYEDTNGCAG